MTIKVKDIFIQLLKLTNPLSLLPGILIFLFVTIMVFKYNIQAALINTIIFVSFSHLGSTLNLSALLLRKADKIKENNVYVFYSNTNFFIVNYFFLSRSADNIIRYDMSLNERKIINNVDQSLLDKSTAVINKKDYAIIKLK